MLMQTHHSVDPSMQLKDIEEKVLVNGKYIENPTAKNINEYIKTNSNYLGSKNMNGQYMYAINKEGQIIIGTRAKQLIGTHVPHPTLIGGKNPVVKGAGIIEIRGGKIYKIDNASGHFKPDNNSLINIEKAFKNIPSKLFHKDFKGVEKYTK
ncbi:hypothetical protein [Fusobacterium sp. PH5-44]|uniref:hypothetical protein n=1 Tax=unclassified Fusobacterium TaxID=2648384 RepID=UPI003D1D392B